MDVGGGGGGIQGKKVKTAKVSPSQRHSSLGEHLASVRRFPRAHPSLPRPGGPRRYTRRASSSRRRAVQNGEPTPRGQKPRQACSRAAFLHATESRHRARTRTGASPRHDCTCCTALCELASPHRLAGRAHNNDMHARRTRPRSVATVWNLLCSRLGPFCFSKCSVVVLFSLPSVPCCSLVFLSVPYCSFCVCLVLLPVRKCS